MENKKSDRKKSKLAILILFLVFTIISIVVGLFAFAKYVKENQYVLNVKFKDGTIKESEIQLSTEEWTADSITAKITKNTKGVIYYKTVSKGEDEQSKEWIQYTGEFEIKKNCKIYAKIQFKDGEGPITTKDVTNIAVATTKIGEKVTGYETLQEAIDAAGTNEAVVTLIKGVIEEGATVKQNQNIELDLNGKTIKQDGLTLTNNGILTIKNDGKITGTTNNIMLNNGTLTLEEGVIIEVTGTEEYTVAESSIINNYGVLSLNNSIINSEYGGINNYDSGKVTVSGGGIETKSTTIRNFGDLDTENEPAIKISGDVIMTSQEANTISNDLNAGLVHIDGGTLCSKTGGTPTVLNCTGKIIITNRNNKLWWK